MKKSVIFLFFIIVSITSVAQVKTNENIVNNKVSKIQATDAVVYRLFPTQNMWTFIKLNTRTGQLWQVQYDIKESNRFETTLSLVPLVTNEDESNGRFTLYPTQNIYTFLLLDQLDGRTWQVQWAIEAEKRLVIRIW